MSVVTETELQQKAVAPRVTLADVEASIGKTEFMLPTEYPALGTTTLCILTLVNGFTVRGFSACASLANFNADIGQRLAKEDAVRQIWALLGFSLMTKLSGRDPLASAGSFTDRLGWEVRDLTQKLDKLTPFIQGDAFKGLSQDAQSDLREQKKAMEDYQWVAKRRLRKLAVN